MATDERICKNCECLSLDDAPVCYVHGYPMEVSAEFSCEKWHPRLDCDIRELERAAHAATPGPWEVSIAEDACFVESAKGTVAEMVSDGPCIDRELRPLCGLQRDTGERNRMTDFCFQQLMDKVYDDAQRQPHISCRHDDVLINPFEVMRLIEEVQKRLKACDALKCKDTARSTILS